MTLPKDWKRGDILRVIDLDPGDPCELGDIVTHDDDVDGESAPYCLTPDKTKWAFSGYRQLEFVSRPEDEA